MKKTTIHHIQRCSKSLNYSCNVNLVAHKYGGYNVNYDNIFTCRRLSNTIISDRKRIIIIIIIKFSRRAYSITL